MGKSSKKIKSNRINALRKQYDSFLEEDKKRKERNEYILGKLDKMVYSNVLVPARTKPTSIVNRPSTMCHLPYQAQVPVARTIPPADVKLQLRQDIPVQCIDDTYLIQEVSKKFILIPKLKSPSSSSYLQHTQPVSNGGIIQELNGKQEINTLKTSNLQQICSSDNTDWKSKYEILNILKKDKTETESVPFAPKRSPENLLNNTREKVFVGSDNIMTEDMHYNTNYKDLNELPEKDISDEKINYELGNNNDISDTLIIKPDPIVYVSTDNVVDAVGNIGYELQKTRLFDGNHIETDVTNPSADETICVENADDYNYIKPTDRLVGDLTQYAKQPPDGDTNLDYAEYNYTEPGLPIPAEPELMQHADHLESVQDTNRMLEEKLGEAEIEVSAEQYKSGNVEKELYIEEHDAESVHVISSKDLIKEIYNNPTVCDNGAKDYVDYEPVLSGVDGLTSNIDIKMKISHDAASEQTGNIHPVSTTDKQRSPSETVPDLKDDKEAVDTVSIQDFDAEQREMFYSEHPEGYEYQQGDGNTYNQEYQQMESYQENETYPQNENYPQDQNYPQNSNYYDGNLQQYPVDVDEDEEHLKLRYDQSYHQQYVDPYEKAYNKQPSEYQESETYQPIHPEQIEAIYDDQTYENPDQIEATVDKEEGFNEPTPEVISQAEETKIPDSK